MIVALTGASYNAGDFLIVDRGSRLLQSVFPEHHIAYQHRNYPVADHGDMVILLGGPSVVSQAYPKVYPLDLENIHVPIVAVGIGAWEREVEFSKDTMGFFNSLAKPIGVRDTLTKRVFADNGISDTRIVGCPAWYNLPNVGVSVRPRLPFWQRTLRHIAFTPSLLNSSSFDEQRITLNAIASMFPKKRGYIICQGQMGDDMFASEEAKAFMKELVEEGESLGFKIVNCTGNLEALEAICKRMDFVIGYRVHTHINMLSIGKPSLLLEADGRAWGANELMGLQGFTHLNRAWMKDQIENGFEDYADVHEKILYYYGEMVDYLETMKKGIHESGYTSG